jgi:aminocarboxymuconate-semialdehyde decarboxylase
MGPVVDFHAHFLPRGAVEAYASGAAWFGTTIEKNDRGWPVLVTANARRPMGSTAYWDSITERTAKMSAVGVDVQALSVLPNLYRYGLDAADGERASIEINDEIAEAIASAPGRFIGLGTLPLQDTDASLREIGRIMAVPGFVGIAVGTHVNGENWDSPRLLPVLEAIRDLNGIVFMHPAGHRIQGTMPGYHLANLIGNPYETTVAIGSLVFSGALDRVDGIKLIFAHGGGFGALNVGRFDHGYSVRTDSQAHARNMPSEYLRTLYFDCLVHGDRTLRFLLDVVGADHVVLGTDYPADMGLARPQEWLNGLSLVTDAERAAILSGNAHSLLTGVGVDLGIRQ